MNEREKMKRSVRDSLAVGCMRMAALTDREAEAVVLDAVECGVTLFDHADIYGGGESEAIFGRVLARNPGLREKIILQDKCGICSGYYDSSKEHILEAVDGSLRRLGVESIDILLLHRPDALMEPEEIAEAFARLEREGKVKRFGVSNMNAVQIALLSAAMPGKVTVNQIQFGLGHSVLVDEGINVNTNAPQGIVRTGGVLDVCRLQGIEVQAWSPLQYGMFEGAFMQAPQYEKLACAVRDMAGQKGVSPTAIAIAWIMRHPAHIRTVLGSMNIAHLREAYQAAEVCLTRPEWYQLYLLAGNPLP